MRWFSRRGGNGARDKPPGEKEPEGSLYPPYTSIWGAAEAHELRGSEAIYAAVTRISNTVACMGLHLYKDYLIAKDDPRERLVGYAPNANMTPYVFKAAVEACRNTTGVGYVLIVPGKDMVTPERLDVLQPSRVQPLIDTATKDLWYEIALDDGQMARVHGSSMIVLRHMSSDGVSGLSPIEVLGGTLKYDRRIKEVSIKQLEQVSGAVALTVPSSVGGPKRDEYVKAFLDAYRKSNGQVIVLDGGITADLLSGSVVDPKVLEVDSITKNKVATVYNMPPRMLGDTKSSGYTTSEQDMAEFVKLTILPIATQWEEMLNRRLLTFKEYSAGYAFRFSMHELQRGDTAAMADRHTKGVRGGYIMPNEARRENGLPPVANGDRLLASRDLMPMDVIVEHPEMLLGKGLPTREEKNRAYEEGKE